MVRPDVFDEYEDEWATGRFTSGARHVYAPSQKPSRPKARDDGFSHRTTEFLGPEHSSWSTGLHRTKSTGHAPTPNVTIINTSHMDNESNPNVRTEQRSPQPSPLVDPYARGRPRHMPGEWAIEDEIAELRHEIKKQRSRSRSDAAHHRHRQHSPNHDYEKWQLQQANLRLREAEERQEQERREELIRRKLELDYIKDKQKHEDEEARIKSDEERFKREWELRHEREDRKRTEREREAEEDRRKIIAEQTAKMEKEERERQHRAFEREEERKRIIMENTTKMEKEERERQRQALEREEERKRIIIENTAKMEKEERERQQRAIEKEEERKRIIIENAAKMEKQEREVREARQRAVDEFNKEKAEKERRAKEERERAVAEYEAQKASDAAKAKRQKEELIMQLRLEEEERKQKEKEEWERFLLKQKQKEQEEKEKKEQQEKQLEEEMRKRLAHFGFQDNQIQAMIKPDEAPRLQPGLSPANPMRLPVQPTYVKVHKEHLAVDTLHYYDIPYEFDRVSDPAIKFPNMQLISYRQTPTILSLCARWSQERRKFFLSILVVSAHEALLAFSSKNDMTMGSRNTLGYAGGSLQGRRRVVEAPQSGLWDSRRCSIEDLVTILC
jgi:hypothetical protein